MPSEFHYRGAKRARQARDELGLGQDGPVDDLLRTVEGAVGAHVVVLRLPDDVAGAFVDRPGMPLLIVCGTDGLARQRFTLAHELGHLRLGHGGVVDRQHSLSGYDHDPCEVEANSFAAEFLIPKSAMLAWAAGRETRRALTLEDVVRLAWEYGVSAQMLRFRLNTCGLLSAGDLQDRLDTEIADGLHFELADQLGLSPLDDSLAAEVQQLPRIPGALRHSLFGDLLAGEIGTDGFAERLDCTPEKARTMLVGLGLDQLLPAVG